MKNLVFTLLFLAAISAVGQENTREGKSHTSSHTKMTPEQMAILSTKQMTLALELSKEQQGKVEKLNLENAKLRQSKMEAYKTKKESGETKRPTSEERFAMANSRLDHQIAVQEQMKQILNKDQFEKWKSMNQRSGKKQGHRHGSRHDGRYPKSKPGKR
ncbi:hypothetical protein U1E44_06770 [Arenibacter sp. GZD96]|uniref:hypothetical protein n=1 Tax=Aurantibrevibacter litoralis TaxID=3106030 RepID=UPI002B0020C0|nr:hypothetical protein [Arenibacter sp. GZD-96]MEA1785787.1 hypothetical protein [Arenibacter sp. GZD-96]